MKTKRYTFKWYKKRDGRRTAWLSISSNGILHLGRVLREKLPERIQIGFDQGQRTLAVMKGGAEGFSWPRSGAFVLEDLPAELMDLGLKLPLSFQLRYDSAEACWLGKPYPRRVAQMDTQGGRQYDIEQLMAIYPDIIPDPWPSSQNRLRWRSGGPSRQRPFARQHAAIDQAMGNWRNISPRRCRPY